MAPVWLFSQFVFILHLPRSFSGAIVAPAGRLKKVIQLILEACFFIQIACNRPPLVRYDMYGVEGLFKWFGKAVNGWFGRCFCGKCAENAVPDNEQHAHVLVKVRNIAGMVYPVV